MKKVLFLLLSLVIFGTANVSAQIRIGGDLPPNDAAVLDLNVDDDTNTGTKGLALPRVSLDSNEDKLGYSALLEGMLVYNTNAGMTDGDGVGVYYWDGSQWIKPTASIDTEIADGAVTTDKLANAAITSDKLATGSVSMAKTQLTRHTVSITIPAGSANTNFTMPAGCDNTNSWFSDVRFNGSTPCFVRRSGTGFMATIVPAPSTAITWDFLMFCFH